MHNTDRHDLKLKGNKAEKYTHYNWPLTYPAISLDLARSNNTKLREQFTASSMHIRLFLTEQNQINNFQACQGNIKLEF
jgi:hypothetical protein